MLVDRLMWLAAASPNGQVRAIATLQAVEAAARAKTAVNKTELDTAQRQLLAADIKRFLDRPLDPGAAVPARRPRCAAGAPIGDMPMDWLARPAGWDWQEQGR